MGAAVIVGGLLVGTASYAADLGGDDQHRTGNSLVRDWSARTDGQQVLGGHRAPGVPSVQRLRHDDVTFTVTVAPARPGPHPPCGGIRRIYKPTGNAVWASQ